MERKSIHLYTEALRQEEKKAAPCKNVHQKMRGLDEINTHTTADQERTGEGRELVTEDTDSVQKIKNKINIGEANISNSNKHIVALGPR